MRYLVTFFAGFLMSWWIFVHRVSRQSPESSERFQEKLETRLSPRAKGEGPERQETPAEPAINVADSNKRIQEINERFWAALNNQDFAEAKLAAEDLGQIAPKSIEYHEYRTHVLVATKQYEGARPALEECLVQFPKSKSCLHDFSVLMMQIGSIEDQLAAAQRCLEQWPDYPSCLNDLAIVYMHQGRFAEAIGIYERLMQINGNYGVAMHWDMLHSQMGFALEGDGRVADAAAEFDKACRSNYPGACLKFHELSERL